MSRHRLTRRHTLRLAGAGAGLAGATIAGQIRSTRTARAQADGVEIEIGLLQGFAEPDHPAMQLIDAFNEQDLGVQVAGTSYGANYEEVLQRAQANISAQIGPSLVTTGWKYALFADAALDIVDLREVGGDQLDTVLGRYRPWVVDIVRVGDKIAGLPFALSTPVLYYNQDLF
nr:carbohydrate ABC transporter substrate-binding protein [Chloroflexia bacterium]